MHSKKTILLLLAFHLCFVSHSQNNCNGIFSGQVQDESNDTVIGAAIILIPSQRGQATDLQGNFKFNGLCYGAYKVRIQYLGYKDLEFEIQVNGEVHKTIHLEEGATQLNEVVIHHHDTALTEHAQNYVQLNEKQLEESAGKSLGETLREIPGVNTIQTGPGIFKPVIHGVHSQRILMLNYGIRQEGQQWGAEHAPEIDPFIASNVVVIKDASAIKFGSDAIGGVILVNPPPLPESAVLGGTFNTVLQSNGRSATVSGMLEGGIKGHDGWGWRIQGTGKKTGDFNTPDYSLTNTGLKEANFSAAAGYHKESKGVDVFFSHFQSEVGILKGTSIGNLDDLASAMEREVPEYTTSFSYAITEPRQTVSHNLLKVNGHFRTDAGEWKLQYGFQNNNRREYDLRIGDLSRIPSIDLQLNTQTLDGEWETHTEKRTMSIGFNGMLQDNNNLPGTQRIAFIPNFYNASAGIFGITKLYFNEWTLDLGTRYDSRHYDVKGYDFKNSLYSTSFGFNNISATAGASIQLGKDQTLNLNMSSAWRPPHVAELYSVGTHQSAAAIEYGLLLNDTTNEIMNIDDANFRTEQAVKFVASYEKRWANFTLDVSPYANHIFNYIYLRPVGITKNVRGVYPYFRYAQTDALFLGTDITGTWQPARQFTVTSKVSLLKASDESNHDYLAYIPSNRYEVALRYENPQLALFKNFYVESKTSYVAKQTRAPAVITVREIKEAQEENFSFNPGGGNFDFLAPPEAYVLWDLAAGVSIKTRKMKYDFRIASQNTLNQNYREYTNRFRYYAGDLGRNIVLSFKSIF
jgi:iron complex outermembrane receptor protein